MFDTWRRKRKVKKLKHLRAKAAASQAIYDTTLMLAERKRTISNFQQDDMQEHSGKAAYYNNLAQALEEELNDKNDTR